MERQASQGGRAQANSEQSNEPPEAVVDDLQQVKYIAEERATFFWQAGYAGPEDIADADPAELVADVYNVGPSLAETVIEGARDLVGDDREVTESDLSDAKDAHAYSDTSAPKEEVDQSGVSLEAVEDLDGSTLDVSNDEDEGSDDPKEVTPEEFQRRLITREDGTEFWYRDPETEALITPYYAPGFEQWCEARGRDPEDFQ